jgi:hypothetical protein
MSSDTLRVNLLEYGIRYVVFPLIIAVSLAFTFALTLRACGLYSDWGWLAEGIVPGAVAGVIVYVSINLQDQRIRVPQSPE